MCTLSTDKFKPVRVIAVAVGFNTPVVTTVPFTLIVGMSIMARWIE